MKSLSYHNSQVCNGLSAFHQIHYDTLLPYPSVLRVLLLPATLVLSTSADFSQPEVSASCAVRVVEYGTTVANQ